MQISKLMTSSVHQWYHQKMDHKTKNISENKIVTLFKLDNL